MKNLILIAFLVMVSVAAELHAAVVEGLYEAEVLVPSQARSERNKAMGTALTEVFAKVSGRTNIVSVPGIAAAIEKPDRYLQQYLYRDLADSQFANSRTNPNAQVLWFRFDEKAVNRELRRNELAVWGRTRPATLVWLAIEQDGDRYILSSDNDEQLREVLEYQAKRMGLALVLPLLDLEDQRALSFADVWGGFQEAILNASQRYQAEAVLVGRVNLSRTDVWQARWALYVGGPQSSTAWNAQGSYLDEVLTAGLAGTLNQLAQVYAQPLSDDSPGEVMVAVVDVNSLDDYARVQDYLKGLEQVVDIQPVTVDQNYVRFRVDIRGSAAGLEQTIGLGNVLRKEQFVIEPQKKLLRPENVGSAFFGVTTSNDNTMPMPAQRGPVEYSYRLLP
jgi:hypothetical protein